MLTATNKTSSLAGDCSVDFHAALAPISDSKILNTVAKGSVASTFTFAQKNVTAEEVAVPIL